MEKFIQLIQNEADKCVKCGLCLPYCPTYNETHQEGESPRGRIALLQGIAAQELSLTPSAERYLDHCLACNACEIVCPAHVQYSRLIIAGRALMAEKSKSDKKINFNYQKLMKKCILFLIPKLYFIRKFIHLPRAIQTTALLDNVKIQQTEKKTNLSLGLLPGCIHTFFEKQVFLDLIKIFNYLQINIEVIHQFKCCGGLHAHAGDYKTFEKLIAENQYLFKKFETVLSAASGCTAVLNQNFTNVSSISDYLNTLDLNFLKYLNNKNIKKQTLLIHTPCTAKKNLQASDFLENLPHTEIIYLKNTFCCGAAGAYFLDYPKTAEKLANHIIQEIKAISLARKNPPDIFVTQNIGCAIHLKKQFRKNNLAIKIQHPINILAAHLFA